MSETDMKTLSWVFVALIPISAAGFLYSGPPASASSDHDVAQTLRAGGNIRPLTEILTRAELADMRVLEVELEREHGRMVYELELLDANGRVHERYYDASTGEPLEDAGD